MFYIHEKQRNSYLNVTIFWTSVKEGMVGFVQKNKKSLKIYMFRKNYLV